MNGLNITEDLQSTKLGQNLRSIFWSWKSTINQTVFGTYVVSFGAVVVIRWSSPVSGIECVTLASNWNQLNRIISQPKNLKAKVFKDLFNLKQQNYSKVISESKSKSLNGSLNHLMDHLATKKIWMQELKRNIKHFKWSSLNKRIWKQEFKRIV